MTPTKLEEAFELLWSVLKLRAGDPNIVRNRLARLIVTYDRYHPDATADELAKSVLRMFSTSRNDLKDDEQ